MIPGDTCDLSDVRERQAFTLNGRLGIVVSRDPADRASGVTTVQWDAGGQETFIWDHADPKVEYQGRAKLTVKVEVLE